MLNGDSVLFNRQPSLHKLSMMGHVAKILPVKTFPIHPGVCEPYNADFDGDEMNMHMPQTLEARQEIERILDVKHQLISPSSGESVIGCNQDSITGLYILTKGNFNITKQKAVEFLFDINYKDIDRINFKEKVSGAELFSILLPKDFNFIDENKFGNILIEEGVLKKGVIDKKIVGSGGGTLLRHLQKNYPTEVVLETISYLSNIGIEVLLKRGFTISMEDFDVSEEISKKISNMNKQAYRKFDNLYEKFKEGNLKRLTGLTEEQTFEIKTVQILNQIRDDCLNIVKEELNPNSGTMLMTTSGGMGKVISIVQMHTGVGQQILRGSRICRGFKNRTLSCFEKDDLSPIARGYIESPLRIGLNSY